MHKRDARGESYEMRYGVDARDGEGNRIKRFGVEKCLWCG